SSTIDPKGGLHLFWDRVVSGKNPAKNTTRSCHGANHVSRGASSSWRQFPSDSHYSRMGWALGFRRPLSTGRAGLPLSLSAEQVGIDQSREWQLWALQTR